jgi:hypothetical protein
VPGQHFTVVVRRGEPARCPQCGMWVEPHTEHPTTSVRIIHCWCDNWLDIAYVNYVIEELGVLR